jgi:hypothetical protein
MPINICVPVFVHLLYVFSGNQIIVINVAAYPQLVISSKCIRIDVELVEWAAGLGWAAISDMNNYSIH